MPYKADPVTDHQWITDPPVKLRSGEEFMLDANNLEMLFAKYGATEQKGGAATAQWDDHVTEFPHALARIKLAPENAKKSGLSELYYSYMVVGQPVGMMILIEKFRYISIQDLVTLPSVADCGGLMVEFAVNLSERKGNSGKLKLTAATKGAEKAYLAMGFATEEANVMQLTPGSSDKWSKLESGWKMAKYANKGYRIITSL
jgi:hypothetical protein